MCGIMGYVGKRIADRVLIDGLKKLEYRGYDSAGICVFENEQLEVCKKVGKLINLETILAEKRLTSRIGIGHTRWATHGKPTEKNAHPHCSSNQLITVVHNGIIENYVALKKKLEKKYSFKSETDTEVISHLIEYYYDKYAKSSNRFFKAVQSAIKDLEGSYALGIMCKDYPDTLIVAKNSSPLILGIGENENFIASDATAILAYTNKILILEDGDIGVLNRKNIDIYDINGNQIERPISDIKWDPMLAEKGGYKHFMLKEIYDQPKVISDTLRGRIDFAQNNITFSNFHISKSMIKKISRVLILACGTSYHAGLIGKFLIEDFAGIPCEVDIASEFRYRNHHNVLDENCLVIAISQSGETADTIASFQAAKKLGVKNLVICNVMNSSLARKSDNVIYTRCGPEIGVASTKAFTGQLCALYLLALKLGKELEFINNERLEKILKELINIPALMEKTLKTTYKTMEEWAQLFFNKKSFLYLGRNINYPIALEGALKLKEISYIHAEGYPAGEMKHGPIALIDENMPVLTIATVSSVYDKIASNLQEARSRDGNILVIASEGDTKIGAEALYVCYVPKTIDILSPIINIIPLQFLAYFIAEIRGCDVDQPRNLAKSVTVE
ncbi:glutamine--fructose-6-phosphate transaminase (isomerizing) [bacterium]